MASNSPEIQQDPEHGRGWAVIRIPGVSSPPERFEFAIQDNANAKWFNDDGNWVGSQTEILPREWAHRGDTLELIVGPDVVNRLLPQPVWLIMSQVGVKAKVRWPKLEPSSPGTPPPEKQRGQPPRRGNNGGGEPIDPKPGPAPPRLIATAVGLLILGGVLGALLAWLLLGDEDYRVANLRDQVATLTQERDAARADLADARDRAERLQEQLDRADGTDQRLQNLRDQVASLERELAERPDAQALADARAEAERLRGDLADARERIRELEHQAETQSPPESAVAQVFSQNRETLVSDIGVTTTILPRLRQRIENGESITRAVRRIYGSRDNGLTEFLCDKLPDRCK